MSKPDRSELDHWLIDAQLVAEESETTLATQKAFLDAEDALLEWDRYIHSLSLEEAQTALEGLREYADSMLKEREIVYGWVRFEI